MNGACVVKLTRSPVGQDARIGTAVCVCYVWFMVARRTVWIVRLASVLGATSLLAAGISNAQQMSTPVPRKAGTAVVTVSNVDKGYKGSHRFAIICYRHARSVFLATPNNPPWR